MPGLPEEVAFISGVTANGTVSSDTGASGAKWGGITAGSSGGVVQYYFDPASNWNATEQKFLAAGLQLWSDIANITFVATTVAGQAQLDFVRGSSGTASTAENYTDLSPNQTGGIAGSSYLDHLTSVTIAIDTNRVGFGPIDGTFTTYGGNPIATFLHEEGHALGLGHAGPYNGSVNLSTQQYSPYDTLQWSVMSYIYPTNPNAEYFSQYPVTGTNWRTTQSNEPTGLMPLDILAAQALYGVPNAANTPLSGGQTFGFNSNVQGASGMFFDFTKNVNPIITLWDLGTNNTLDLSGYSTGSIVNLAPGTFSSCDGMTNNIAIAYNTAIDRAICGAGNDIIAGNNDGDYLSGGSGNDIITGGSGNDTIVASGNSIVDGGGGVNTFVANGLYSSAAITQTGSTAKVFGVLLTNIQFVQFQDRAVQISGSVQTPSVVLTTSNISATSQVLALSSLFSVTDSAGNAMTRYQLWDGTTDPSSGHFAVNGVVQAAGTVIDITAAQLAQTSFVTGSVADTLQIRAYDGIVWSAADTAAWAPFTVTPLINHAPVVTTSNVSTSRNQTLALSSLFSVSDADGDAITKYQIWDGNSDPLSGHFVVNGVAQAARTVIDITPAQLAQTSFVTGSVADNLQIRAYDGSVWSAADTAAWALFAVSPPADHAPVVITSNISSASNQTLALSSLISVSDADGDAITKYQLWDGTTDPASGHFAVNGVAQAAGTVIEITAAQLAQTSFVTGSVADSLQIRAFDGITWSAPDTAAWSQFAVSPPVNHPPVVSTANVSTTRNQTLALSSLFSVSDADGDAMTSYQLWDGTRDSNSGHFVVNGVVQAAGTVITITAAQLAQTSFVSGLVSDNLQIRASDGSAWSAAFTAAWAPFTVSPPANHAPIIADNNVTLAHLQTYALSSLFSVSDADSDTITGYQLWDSTRDPASGHFVVNGVAQAASTVIDISAAQLAQTSFVTGSVGDNLQIRAFDGISWSAGDNAAWSPFAITVPANHAPIITDNNVTLAHLQTYALSSLFSVSDADSDAITRYQLWDSTRDPASGHFVVNGVAQAAATVIDITAAQLAQTSFITGGVGDNLQIRAFDGISWSAGDNAAWSPFTITVPANHAPVVITGTVSSQHSQTLALSSLFQVSDADSDPMTRYQLWDSTRDPNSGHFVVSGIAQAAGTVIDITAAQLAQTSFVTGAVNDSLQIRAFDGISWSAADTAVWSPFAVSVPAYTLPVVTTADVTVPHGQAQALSSLFSVSDPDGDAMTKYQLWDSTRDPSSGHFVVNGVAQSAGTVIDITAAQLAQTSFLAGTVGDNLQIRAFDGFNWSAPSTAAWSPFHIAVS